MPIHWWEGEVPTPPTPEPETPDTSNAVFVEDYGAVGDGITDDSAAIQSAIVAALEQSKVLLFQAKVYAVATEVFLYNTGPLDLRGTKVGTTVTTLRAAASMTAVLGVAGTHLIRGIVFDANRLATHAVALNGGAAFTKLTDCKATNALRNGFWIGDTGVNDALTFQDCDATYNGTWRRTAGAPSASSWLLAGQQLSVSGTVTTASGSAIVTGSGTSFLSHGLLTGDLILVGASSTEIGQVVSVDSDTQITCAQNFTMSRNTQQYGTLAGCGLAEARHNDANINKITGGLWRSNAAAGLMIRGLYGSHILNAQIDTNAGFGVIIGQAEIGAPTYNPTVQNCYFETNGMVAAGSVFRLGAAEGCALLNNMCEGSTILSYGIATSVISGLLFSKSTLATLGNANSFNITAPVSQIHRNGLLLSGPLLANFANLGSDAGAALNLDSLDQLAAELQLYFYTTANVTVTATPSITGTATDGQIFRLTNFDASYTTTFQDESVLAGSKLKLTAPKRAVGPGESILFQYHSNFFWEIGGTRDFRPADSTASPGAATQDKRAGRVAIAAAATSVVVTNARVTSTSVIHATLQTVDATLTQILQVVPGAGSFTIYGNAAATAATTVCWSLVS